MGLTDALNRRMLARSHRQGTLVLRLSCFNRRW